MDFNFQSELTKFFLGQYNEKVYPELFSRLIDIGILTLKLSFNKLNFSSKELDDIIYSLREQDIQENHQSIKSQNLKKLTNTKNIQRETEFNDTLKYNTISIDNKFNNNFYDTNYKIPENKSLRNKQLYQKRLEKPLFTTMNKDVYPFWWWNFPDDEEGYININNSLDEEKIFNKNLNNYNRGRKNKNLINKTNYKISYDKNLNIIEVEKGNNKKNNYIIKSQK